MPDRETRVIIVDDNEDLLTAARLLLKRQVGKVETLNRPDGLPELIERLAPDAVLLDMNYALGARSGAEGLMWFDRVRALDPALSVVLITAHGDVDIAVSAMKKGAADFVLKPWDNDRLSATVRAAINLTRTKREAEALRRQNAGLAAHLSGPGAEVVVGSGALGQIMALVARVAPTPANVLILGENGTGKSLIAKEIHRLSQRAEAPFVPVDLGAIPGSLFESELFGHKKGAFTDAKADRVGRMAAADQGTLFLDEIGNLPLVLQAKLLGVLENRVVMPVGGTKPQPIDIRLISATNLSPQVLKNADNFRPDLLYRINTVEITLPPLRDRRAEIPALASYFLEQDARRYGLGAKRFSSGALDRLSAYDWPGNIRALRHTVERALIMAAGPVIEADDLALADERPAPQPAVTPALASDGAASLELDQLEKQAITTALARHQGNVSHAAKALGLSRAALYRRMERHGL